MPYALRFGPFRAGVLVSLLTIRLRKEIQWAVCQTVL